MSTFASDRSAAQAESRDIVRPRALIAIESAAILIAAVVLYAYHGESWLIFGALILAPDLSMAGYFVGPRVGAFVYNLAHVYAGPAALGAVGIITGQDVVIALALIWLAHIGMDRAIGYGLKYATGFKDSHLSRV